MKTHIDQTSANDILESASAADLLMLAILSGRRGRSEVQQVLDKRALGGAKGHKRARRPAGQRTAA
ncbi:MAG: hypothetical protein U0570_07020 [Phycisphaerales bacterium]